MPMEVGSVNNVYAAYSIQKTMKNSQVGKTNVKTANRIGKTDVRIAPEVLNGMTSNPEAAAKYENMLSKIPALDRWADSMIKSMTGSEVKCRQVWIDKDGNMGSMCITGPSDEQKKAMRIKKSIGTASFAGENFNRKV